MRESTIKDEMFACNGSAVAGNTFSIIQGEFLEQVLCAHERHFLFFFKNNKKPSNLTFFLRVIFINITDLFWARIQNGKFNLFYFIKPVLSFLRCNYNNIKI